MEPPTEVLAPATSERAVAGVVAPPPLIYGAGFCAGLLIDVVLPRVGAGPIRALGMPLVVSGVLLGGWALKAMFAAGTPPQPSEPTRKLVTTGPFAFSRNPIYAGLTLAYVGLALLLGRLGPLTALPAVLAVMQRGVIDREERYLTLRFGTSYRHYLRTVPRWLGARTAQPVENE